MKTPRTLLVVLDGFGIGKDSPFNAIANAKMPFYRDLWKKYPHSQLLTHGRAVGLPEGVMGNSEVGHMTMGAGRIIYQDLTRISQSIMDQSFFKNAVLKETLHAGASSRVHLMGLLSDGGVHSHIDHLFALLELCEQEKIPEVSLHLFTDGRDTSPTSGASYVQKLLQHRVFTKDSQTRVRIASLSGRYYAMDRDQRWDRIQRAYEAMLGMKPLETSGSEPCNESVDESVMAYLEASYARGITDEFVEPISLNPEAALQDGDSLIFFNYRSDRAREISQVLTQADFSPFPKKQGIRISAFAGMTAYDQKNPLPMAFGPQNLNHIFGEWLEMKGLTQFRIAETEKYAHVTFFFNGGREAPFRGEDRVLIPSPKDVATYDLKPEMSAAAVAEEAEKRLRSAAYAFTLINFANADMVGHTGNYEATIRAMEALDRCIARVVGAAHQSDTHVIITADHGNAEEMRDCHGQNHTQHTLNPVPAIWVAPQTAIAPKSARIAMRDGGLQDIMPTLCTLMNLPIPPEVTGKTLID